MNVVAINKAPMSNPGRESYGLDPKQFLVGLVRPTLKYLNQWSTSAGVLLLGTALVESRLRYIDIQDHSLKSEAFGLWQMDRDMHDGIYRNYLNVRMPSRLFLCRELRAAVLTLVAPFKGVAPPPGVMVYNLAYACAMARVQYLLSNKGLPPFDDPMAMAHFHREHYASLGAVNIEYTTHDFQHALVIMRQLLLTSRRF